MIGWSVYIHFAFEKKIDRDRLLNEIYQYMQKQHPDKMVYLDGSNTHTATVTEEM